MDCSWIAWAAISFPVPLTAWTVPLDALPPPGWADHAVALLRDEPDDGGALGPAYGFVEALGAVGPADPPVRLAL